MATTVASQGPARLETTLAVTTSVPAIPPMAMSERRLIRVAKFSRLSNTRAPDPRIALLTVADIKASHRRLASVALARREALQETRRAQALAGLAVAKTPHLAAVSSPSLHIDPIRTGSTSPLLTAMIEPETEKAKPFDLVFNDAAASVLRDLPETGPTPLGRPGDRKAAETLPEKTAVARRQVGKELAYAKPGASSFLENLFGGGNAAKPLRGSKVAIYDISAGRVHLPDGTQLEAHSGIGPMRDNPNFVHKKMAGSTPPGTFRLSMREALFHGVAALRMTPVDGVHPHGRTGLLTHSYLLGKNGNSHGCVAFKDYQRFLKAFKRGDIDHLIVVPRMPASRTQIAALLRKVG